MKDLTSGDETRQLIWFALPMLLGNVFQQFYNMVDSFVVGRFIGTEALAAVGTSFPILFLMLSLIMGIAMGSTVLISQYFGKKDLASLSKVVDTSYVFIFSAGILVTAGGILATPFILRALAVPQGIFEPAAAYLRIIFAGMITTFGYNGVSAMLRGLGDSKTPLLLLVASTLTNIVLDLLFVISFGWGVKGAAWATVIAQAISFLGGLYVLDRRNQILRFRFKRLKWDRPSFSLMLKIGLPSGIQQTFVSLGMMVLSRIVNEFGATTMAAFTAASRIDAIAALPAMNLSQAITTFTGQNIGAGKIERVKRGHLSALGLSSAISVAIGLVVILAGAPLIGIFTADAEVIRIGNEYFRIVGFFYFAFSFMMVNNGVLRGAGDVLVPMFITLVALWLVRVPAAFIFTRVLGMGTKGVWWSIPAAWMIGGGASTWYYLAGWWKKKNLIGGVRHNG